MQVWTLWGWLDLFLIIVPERVACGRGVRAAVAGILAGVQAGGWLELGLAVAGRVVVSWDLCLCINICGSPDIFCCINMVGSL